MEGEGRGRGFSEPIGRGRSRGRRVIDLALLRMPNPKASDLPTPPPPTAVISDQKPFLPRMISTGRGFAAPPFNNDTAFVTTGRGIALPPKNHASGQEQEASVNREPKIMVEPKMTVKDPKSVLIKELNDIPNHKECTRLILATVEFILKENDIQFYLDSVWEYSMRSYIVGEIFAKCVKLLTLHVTCGQEIKQKLFKKLQTASGEQPDLKEVKDMDQAAKNRLFNFCNLFGQLFFRFRPFLERSDRYTVLAPCAAKCLRYLVHVRGFQLKNLTYQMYMNAKSLCEQVRATETEEISIRVQEQVAAHMEKLCVELHEALLCTDKIEDRAWFLCAIDTLQRGELSRELLHLYGQRLGETALKRATLQPPVELLAALPSSWNSEDVKVFAVDIDVYNRYRVLSSDVPDQ